MRVNKVLTMALAVLMALSVFVIPYGSVYAEEMETTEPSSQVTDPAPLGTSTNLADATVTIENQPQIYDGSAKEPKVTVSLEGTVLDEADYTVSYTDNIYPGIATVTIEAKGATYTGSTTAKFNISPAKLENARMVSTEVTSTPNADYTSSASTARGYASATFSWNDFSDPDIIYSYTISNASGKALASGNFGAEKKITWLYAGQTYGLVIKAINVNNGKLVAQSNPFYFTTNPVAKSRKISKGYYYYYYVNGNFVGTDRAMWNKVRNSTSKGKYLICVNRTKNNVVIYKGKKGNWKPVKHWLCCCGREGKRTPTGSMKIKSKKWGFSGIDNPKKHTFYTVWHATKFKGACFFHSTLYKYKSKKKNIDTSLGDSRSHGCIRLAKTNAYWIKKYARVGTRVIVYSSN